jgi:hypothetical protein
LSVSVFEQTEMYCALQPDRAPPDMPITMDQLRLFDDWLGKGGLHKLRVMRAEKMSILPATTTVASTSGEWSAANLLQRCGF